jgi:Protein kinase domain
MARQHSSFDGLTIAAYRVDRLIGRGGMGEVYRATDERLQRPVALKILAPRLSDDDGFRDRLMRESRLAASLDHPNVVPVYEAGEDDGRLFIAMRYVDGPDLGGLLRAEGRLGPERAVAVAAQVADALDAAHRRGLVHRDVKPGNVLIDRQDGREHAYLADFGLTRSLHGDGGFDGQFAGTVDYVAPEQIRGDEVTGRADQYALGCMLFESLTGTLPFRHGSEVAAIFAHLEEPPPLATSRQADLPAALDPVLARAMAKDPAERFPDCRALVEAARAALGLSAPPATARRRWLVPALAAAAAVLAAAAAVLVASRGRDAPASPRAGALVRIDPSGNEVSARVRVPGIPGMVAVSSGGVWVADFRDGVLWRYDPAGGAMQRITSEGEPRDLAALGQHVYVAADGDTAKGSVSKYDAATGVREDRIDLLACAIASGGGVVWAAGCPYVQRLDTGPKPLRIRREVFLPFPAPGTASDTRVAFRELAIGDGSLWVLGDALQRVMWQVDARTGRVEATIPLPFPPRSAAVAGGAVWITDAVHDTVVPVDEATHRVGRAIRVGRGAGGVAGGAGAVWVAGSLDGTVTRIDPRARRVVAHIKVGGAPAEIDTGRGAVWVSTDAR